VGLTARDWTARQRWRSGARRRSRSKVKVWFRLQAGSLSRRARRGELNRIAGVRIRRRPRGAEISGYRLAALARRDDHLARGWRAQPFETTSAMVVVAVQVGDELGVAMCASFQEVWLKTGRPVVDQSYASDRPAGRQRTADPARPSCPCDRHRGAGVGHRRQDLVGAASRCERGAQDSRRLVRVE